MPISKRPWEAVRECEGDNQGDRIFIIDSADGQNVYGRYCEYDGGEGQEWIEENRANAYLISAAPEMFDVLQSIVKQHSSRTPSLSPRTIQQARQVLVKAAGGTP